MKTSIYSLATMALCTGTAYSAPGQFNFVFYPQQYYQGTYLELRNQTGGFVCNAVPASFDNRIRSMFILKTPDSDNSAKSCTFYNNAGCGGASITYNFVNATTVPTIPPANDAQFSSFKCGVVA